LLIARQSCGIKFADEDDFSSELNKHQLEDGKKHRNKPCKLSEAEVITILILFHSKGFRCLKHFYAQYVCKRMQLLFPQTVSYNRFVELQKSVALHLIINDRCEILNFMFTPGNVDDREPL